MTNSEALLQRFNYERSVDLALEDANVDGSAIYISIEDKDSIELASAYLMKYAYGAPTITQGDDSLQWDKEDLKGSFNAIFNKYGLKDEMILDDSFVTIFQGN